MADSQWSCVDYVDVPRERVGSGEEKLGVRPGKNELSRRFRNAEGAHDRREDGAGVCMGYVKTEWGRDGKVKPCSELRSMVMLGTRGTAEEGTEHKWYANKQTNSGWPGTAEGKINTAQGMAGDLV